MAILSVRVLLFLVVFCAISVPITSEPIFGKYYCDLFCGDYEDDSSSDSSEEFLDLLMFDPCLFCPSKPKKPHSSPGTTSTTNNPLQQLPFNFLFPPMGMNMTLGKTGSNWFLNFWPFSGSASNSPSSPAAPAPAPPAAGHASSAPGATPAPAPAAGAKPAANTTKAG